MARATVVIDSSDEPSSDSESSNSRPSDALIDNEAVDVDDSNDDASSETVDIAPEDQFPQFMRLPVEIRRQIWDIFCPDVASKHPRILRLLHSFDDSTSTPSLWWFEADIATEDQTEKIRKLAAVHHETRGIVTKAFPDIIPIGRDEGVVRFNGDRDIIFHDQRSSQRLIVRERSRSWHGAHVNIKHVCLEYQDLTHWWFSEETFQSTIIPYLEDMPNLETIMLGIDVSPNYIPHAWKGWLACEQTMEARVNTYRKCESIGEDLEWAYIWPDFKRHPEFLKYEVMPPILTELASQWEDIAAGINAKIVPMLVFDFDNLHYLDVLKERYKKRPWNVHDTEVSTEDESEEEDEGENEYESDGINDDTIEQWDDHDEDELIPPPLEHSTGPILIDSDDRDSSGADDVVEVGESAQPQAANFSSPEPESASEQGRVSRRPKRRIVSDSDDEDDGEPVAKRTKTRAVSVSSDEEEDQGIQQRSRGGSRGAPQVISDDESSESSDGSGDEEESARPLSLQQRLQPVANGRPGSDDDDDKSSDAENSFCSYADGEDEDEQEEDSEEDGVVDRMAGDTDDDNGDRGSDDGW